MDFMNYSNQIGRYFHSGALFLLPAALLAQFLLYILKLVGGVVEDSVSVFAPYPLSLSGDLMVVELRKIKKISKAEYESLPLFVLSAGMVEGKK